MAGKKQELTQQPVSTAESQSVPTLPQPPESLDLEKGEPVTEVTLKVAGKGQKAEKPKVEADKDKSKPRAQKPPKTEDKPKASKPRRRTKKGSEVLEFLEVVPTLGPPSGPKHFELNEAGKIRLIRENLGLKTTTAKWVLCALEKLGAAEGEIEGVQAADVASVVTEEGLQLFQEWGWIHGFYDGSGPLINGFYLQTLWTHVVQKYKFWVREFIEAAVTQHLDMLQPILEKDDA